VQYSKLLDLSIEESPKYEDIDYISLIPKSETEENWCGTIPKKDGMFWTTGRFLNSYREKNGEAGIRDIAISSQIGFFVESDHISLEEQGKRMEEAVEKGLPAPTVVTISGDPRVVGGETGKSLHFFWILDDPYKDPDPLDEIVDPQSPPKKELCEEIVRWKKIQSAIIKATNADPANKNPARKMRLPGGCHGNRHQTILHINKEGAASRSALEKWAESVGASLEKSDSPFSNMGSVEPTPLTVSVDGATVVESRDAEFSIEDWFSDESVPEGKKENIKCVASGSKTVGSAFVKKMPWGVLLVCTAEHHNHPHAGAEGKTRWEWRKPPEITILDSSGVREIAQRVWVEIGEGNSVFTRGEQYYYRERDRTWCPGEALSQDPIQEALDAIEPMFIQGARGLSRITLSPGVLGRLPKEVSGRRRDPSFFSQLREGFCCSNGWVNSDGKLQALERDHRVLRSEIFPINYDEKATCPRWNRFLKEIFLHDEDQEEKIGQLQEFVGACVFGEGTKYQRHALLYGRKAANGKSVFLKTIQELFPPQSVTHVPLQDWSGSFGLSWVPRSKINIVMELPSGKIDKSEQIKNVLTADGINVNEKNKAAFSIVPRAGHLIATNKLPHIIEDSNAVFRRFTVFTFNRVFFGSEAELGLEKKLRQEITGILNWAVEGFKRLKERGEYPKVLASSEAAIEAWKRVSSSTFEFYHDHLVEVSDVKDGTVTQDLYPVYKAWCNDTSNRPVSQRRFADELSRAGASQTRVSSGKKRKCLWNVIFKGKDTLPRHARISLLAIADVKTQQDSPEVVTSCEQFVQSVVVESSDAMENAEIKAEYGKWCEMNGKKQDSSRRLSAALEREGFKSITFRKEGAVKRGRKMGIQNENE